MKPALPTAPWELADFATAKRPAPHLDCFDHRGATATVLARIDGGRPVLIDRHREPVADPTARRKIWDLDGSLHCSVIGTCLTSGELRTLIGKFHMPLADRPTEHTLHTIAVAAAAQHNLIAKQIQKALDRLYVGGRPHQVAKLRGLVEEGSGVLIHHDGGIEERPDLLPGLVSRADAAFFPVDCISHRAALLLKRLCQQAGKPYVPLRSTGVASMLRALRSTNIGIAALRSAAE